MSRSSMDVGRDQGVALVVALLIVAIVFVFTTAMLADAFHNVVGSAEARARLAAINAAEAGVAWYANALESSSLSELKASPWEKDSDNTFKVLATPLKALPGTAEYNLSATYSCSVPYCSDPQLFNFSTLQDAVAPAQMRVVLLATGTSLGVSRTMRAEMIISPSRATLKGAYGGMFLCELGNRFTVTGTNADIYLQGGSGGCKTDRLLITSGQFTTSGSVYVQNGSVCATSTTFIGGTLWANDFVRLGGPNATPCDPGLEEGKSGEGGPCGSSAQVVICGDVVSRTSVNLKKGSVVVGQKQVCSTCPVPTYTFPPISTTDWKKAFDDAPWVSKGSLPTASDFSKAGAPSSPTAFIPTAACTTPQTLDVKNTLYLKSDVALVANCGYTFDNRIEFRKAPNAPRTPTLYLITGDAGTGIAACSSKQYDTAFKQNFSATEINVYVYTPCRLSLTNQTNLTGQLLARQLYAQGRTTINAVNLLGLTGSPEGLIEAFQARVVNVREI